MIQSRVWILIFYLLTLIFFVDYNILPIWLVDELWLMQKVFVYSFIPQFFFLIILLSKPLLEQLSWSRSSNKWGCSNVLLFSTQSRYKMNFLVSRSRLLILILRILIWLLLWLDLHSYLLIQIEDRFVLSVWSWIRFTSPCKLFFFQ